MGLELRRELFGVLGILFEAIAAGVHDQIEDIRREQKKRPRQRPRDPHMHVSGREELRK